MKSKISIDLNKPVEKEEKGLKNGSKLKTLIKKKVEAIREMDDNQQVQALKQKNDDMSASASRKTPLLLHQGS
jgi:ribosomal protein S20